MQEISDTFNTKSFWLEENLRYAEPYFRLEKCARIVNALARGRDCDLLDVGCGPGSLARLLDDNINYYGIDIAIQHSAPNFLEVDLAQNKIGFGNRSFDIVVAAGVFEYLGTLQNQKFSEIRSILTENGFFVVTYTNFNHLKDKLIDHSIYNNVQSVTSFKKGLESHFRVERWFPSSHNWHCSEPRRKYLKRFQMPLEVSIPVFSRLLAINYFFICSPKNH
jgi:cyclopropane fatty-acyl-phospholipid synthase-like methyltransferase